MKLSFCWNDPSLRRRALGLFALFTLGTAAPAFSSPATLTEAVIASSPFWTEHYLLNGADPNTVLEGAPLLVHAVRRGNFDVARLLLQRGAKMSRARQAEPNLLSLIPVDHPEELAINFLLRSYQLAEERARPLPPNFAPAPERVLIYEPTVDYNHPGIAPYYYVNETERNGRPGVDDDGNGFVDDVYGWSAAADVPHQSSAVQTAVWETNREYTQRLVELYNRRQRGELGENSPEWEKLHSTYLNPVASIWGSSGGYSDMDFLEHLIGVSHGSHVSGIVIRESRERARLHTLAWDTFAQEEARQLDFPEVQPGDTYDVLLERFRQNNLNKLVERGRRASDFLRATRASVANGSMGSNLPFFQNRAQGIIANLAQYDPAVRARANVYARRLAYEMYAYNTIPFVIAIAENPQVLFVSSAGNSALNNDEMMQSPAYLSRFFRNVITIAASDASGRVASFTNRGVKSVNIAAFGVNVESYGVAGTRMLMSGTSMSAPAVSGVSAYLRTQYPDATPETIRRALQIGARRSNLWTNLVTSGGVMDVDATSGILRSDAGALTAAVWSLLASDKDARPVEWAWLRRTVVEAASREPSNTDLNYAEAVALDVTGSPDLALRSIDRLLARAPRPGTYWRSKVIILKNLGDHLAILQTAQAFDSKWSAGEIDATGDQVTYIVQSAIEAATALTQPLAIEAWQQRHEALTGNRYRIIDRTVQRFEVTGQLSAESRVDNGRYAQLYQFSAERGMEVTISLTGSSFDTYLKVLSPDGQLWENDDFEGSTRESRLTVTTPHAGNYIVTVTSYAVGETGDFRLSVVGATVRDLAPLAAPVSNRVQGTLDENSEVAENGKRYDGYEIPLRAGDMVDINLRGDGIDTLLVVVGPSGQQWENDDFSGTLNWSRVSFQAPEDGVYQVIVTTYNNTNGPYTLDLEILEMNRASSQSVTERGTLTPARTAAPRALETQQAKPKGKAR